MSEFQESTEPLFYDGNDEPLTNEIVFSEIDLYMKFEDAASHISPYLTVNNLHKWKNTGFVKLSDCMYCIDLEQKKMYPSTGGKVFYIKKTEVERLIDEVLPNKLKNVDTNICPYCRQPLAVCGAKPCVKRFQERIQDARNYEARTGQIANRSFEDET